MDTTTIKKHIKQLHTFFNKRTDEEKKDLLDNKLEISFFDIAEFDFELGDAILSNPNMMIEIIEMQVKTMFDKPNFSLKLKDIPKSEEININDIRTTNLNKIVSINGMIRRMTDVRPMIKHSDYLCTNPSCNFSEDKIIIKETNLKKSNLKYCPKCKSKVELISKNLIDSQIIELEDLKNKSKIQVFLEGDLCKKFNDTDFIPGQRVEVIGIVAEYPIHGKDFIYQDLVIMANNLIRYEKEKEESNNNNNILKVTPNQNVASEMGEYLFKDIIGYGKLKEAIILQLVGGVNTKDKKGTINILIVGDTAVGKTLLFKKLNELFNTVYLKPTEIKGKTLTAEIKKDNITKGWSLNVGDLFLSNDNITIIDGFEEIQTKISPELHELMSLNTLTINKGSIDTTLKNNLSLLASCYPKNGKFDLYKDILKQFNLEPSIISRFDMIFTLRDISDKKRDDIIANSYFSKNKLIINDDIESIKSHLNYAKTLKPKLTKEAIEEIKKFYIESRSWQENNKGSFPITAKMLESIVKFSEAYAKLSLSEEVNITHAKRGIKMITYMLERFGIDTTNGMLDIDKITTGITASNRNTYKLLKQIIERLDTEQPEITFDNICYEAKKYSIESKEIKTILGKFKQEGIIFEPRKDIFKCLR